jgi:hypothetical protein
MKNCPFCGAHLREVDGGYKHPAALCVLTCFFIEDDEIYLWEQRSEAHNGTQSSGGAE